MVVGVVVIIVVALLAVRYDGAKRSRDDVHGHVSDAQAQVRAHPTIVDRVYVTSTLVIEPMWVDKYLCAHARFPPT